MQGYEGFQISLNCSVRDYFQESPWNGIRHILLTIFDATDFTINGKKYKV